MKSKKSKSFQILIFFLALSLGLHSGLFLSLRKWLTAPPSNSTLIPIEVDFKSSPEDRIAKQFVTDPELGELTKKLEQQSRLLSKLARRVKEETVAERSGPTKNQVPKQAVKSNIVENKTPKKNLDKKIRDFQGGLNFNQEAQETTNESSSTYSPPSTIAEYIPNVKKGQFTVLNTDQFTYYAFFKRINEQIRLRWVDRIRLLSFNLPTQIINKLALSPRETKVELVLNAKGEFVNAFVDQSSGSRLVDQAPIDSFIEATPFLNPPQDLVDSDGYIRLNYSFYIEWQPRYIAKEKGPGN